jgi:hypothetical protein
MFCESVVDFLSLQRKPKDSNLSANSQRFGAGCADAEMAQYSLKKGKMPSNGLNPLRLSLLEAESYAERICGTLL